MKKYVYEVVVGEPWEPDTSHGLFADQSKADKVAISIISEYDAWEAEYYDVRVVKRQVIE